MSLEILIIPVLQDLAILTSIMMENHRRATVMERMEKGLATRDEAESMRLEVDSLRRSGCDIRTGDTKGASVLVHTDQGYDIGLKRNDQGSCDIVAHWAQQPGKVEVQQVRADVEGRIKQRYAYEKVKRELAKKGFIISTEEVQPDTTIRLVARKW